MATTQTPATASGRRAAVLAAQQAAARQQRLRRLLAVLAGLVVVALVATVIAVVVSRQREARNNAATSGDPNAQVTPPHASSDGSAIVTTPSASTAPLRLAIHFDYQCPGCEWAETSYGPSIEKLAANGDLVLSYHIHTFLDRLNSGANAASSTRAAIAATCADVAGAFQAYHDALFAHQPTPEGTGFSDASLRTVLAQTAGLAGDALAQFQTCYDNRQTSAFVTTMSTLNSQDSRVQSTPTFLANDTAVDMNALNAVDPADPAALLAFLRQQAGLA